MNIGNYECVETEVIETVGLEMVDGEEVDTEKVSMEMTPLCITPSRHESSKTSSSGTSSNSSAPLVNARKDLHKNVTVLLWKYKPRFINTKKHSTVKQKQIPVLTGEQWVARENKKIEETSVRKPKG